MKVTIRNRESGKLIEQGGFIEAVTALREQGHPAPANLIDYMLLNRSGRSRRTVGNIVLEVRA